MSQGSQNFLRIERVTQLTASAKCFEFSFGSPQAPVYKAGQFLTLVFKTPFGEKRRSYSICSAPLLGEPLAIAVKLVENGEFSRKLINEYAVGDMLETSGIGGFFVLQENAAESSYFFLAAGSGITPCLPLIKTLLYTTQACIVLLFSNQSEESTLFYHELLQWQQQFSKRFTFRFFFSNRFNIFEKRLSAWLLEQILIKHAPTQPSAARFYICGPFDFQVMVSIVIKNRGYLPNQIVKEQFSNLPRKQIPVPPNAEPHCVTLNLGKTDAVLKVQYPNSILAVAKTVGLGLSFSCEAGRCGSCVATCTHGKVWMAYNEILMPDEVEKGRVLLCQAFPLTSATILI